MEHIIGSYRELRLTKVQDFWSVTWQQDARVIVMLTAESEGGQTKCHPYWLPGNYGPFKVQAVGERRASLDPPQLCLGDRSSGQASSRSETGAPANSNLISPDHTGHGRRRSTTISNGQASTVPPPADPDTPHVIIRKLLLSHDAQSYAPVREITQLQYSSWPDFGAPAHPLQVLGLVEQCGEVVRGYSSERGSNDPAPENERPILVHCSAGCGRTGTFCTVDSVIDIMKRQKQAQQGRHAPDLMQQDSSKQGHSWITSEADDLIVKTVKDFRLQRLSMVQTLRQFVLCYESVLEYLAMQMPDSNIKKLVGQDRRSYQG